MGGSIYFCIFVLVSPLKEKTITYLANSFSCGLMREHPPWWSGGGEALHLGVDCAITFRIISENQQSCGIKQLNYTTLMLFNLMLTIKPCTEI